MLARRRRAGYDGVVGSPSPSREGAGTWPRGQDRTIWLARRQHRGRRRTGGPRHVPALGDQRGDRPTRARRVRLRPRRRRTALSRGKRAMGYLEAVCKIGPRVSGSEGMRKQQDLVEKHFKGLGARSATSGYHEMHNKL